MIPDLQSADDFEPLRDVGFDFDKASGPPLSPVRTHIIDHRPSRMEASSPPGSNGNSSASQIYTPLPFRPHRTRTRTDRPSSITSSNELLRLEGQPANSGHMAAVLSASPSITSPAHSLKRKDKFCGRDLIVRRPSNETFGAIRLSPPRSQATSSFDWARQHPEQVSLQSSHSGNPSLPMASLHVSHRQTDRQVNGDVLQRPLYTHRKSWSDQPSIGSGFQPLDYPSDISNPFPRHENLLEHESLERYDVGSHHAHQQPMKHITAHHQPWVDSLNFGSNYVTPNEIQSSPWLQDVSENPDTFYSNPMSYPTSSQNRAVPFDRSGVSNDTSQSSAFGPHSSFEFDQFDSSLDMNHAQVPQPPQTPPPSNPSASPTSPPAPSTPHLQVHQSGSSPQKPARASRKKQGSLRLQKSAAAIKSVKSSNALKSAKSTGNLKSRKSAGNLASAGSGLVGNSSNTTRSPIKKEPSHQKQSTTSAASAKQHLQMQQGLNFGFMNFTPNDKEKILTGVAPSGSSKTKMRREKEASEERKRLSLAAKKEIERLGGEMPLEFLSLSHDVNA